MSESNSLPLVGVRVSDSHKPLWGFTLTRMDGEFDFVVNGGDTIQLRFQRNPFTVRSLRSPPKRMSQKSTVTRYIAPNSIVHIGDVRMYTEKVCCLSLAPTFDVGPPVFTAIVACLFCHL